MFGKRLNMQQLIFHSNFLRRIFIDCRLTWLAVGLFVDTSSQSSPLSPPHAHPTSPMTRKIFRKKKRHTKPPVISSRKARDNLKFIHSDSTSCYNFYFEGKVFLRPRTFEPWSSPPSFEPPQQPDVHPQVRRNEEKRQQAQHMGKTGRRTNTWALSFFFSFLFSLNASKERNASDVKEPPLR